MGKEYGVHNEQKLQYLLSNGFETFLWKKMAILYKDQRISHIC